MNILEMPATLEVDSQSDELDLDSLFDSPPPPLPPSPPPKPPAPPAADVTVEDSPGEPVPNPETERPIESFLPPESVAGPAATLPPAVGVDLVMREVMLQIIEQNDFIRSCEGEVEDAKAELKLAKENFDKAVERLRSLCSKLEFIRKADENDAERPLLNLEAGSPSDEAAVDSPADTPPQNSDETELEPGEISPILEKDPETGVPVRIRLVQDVFEGEKQLLKAGDEFAIADQFDGGEVAIDHPTEGGIIVETHEFEVIQWQHQETPAADPRLELRKFLGCSETQLASFAQSGIGSVDELCEALCHSEDSENLKVLTAIKGVGKKKAEKFLELVKSRR